MEVALRPYLRDTAPARLAPDAPHTAGIRTEGTYDDVAAERVATAARAQPAAMAPPPEAASPHTSKVGRWLLVAAVATVLMAGVIGVPVGIALVSALTEPTVPDDGQRGEPMGVSPDDEGSTTTTSPHPEPTPSSAPAPQRWQRFRNPFLVDVDRDGHEDVVGWASQRVTFSTHEMLCAYRGSDGAIIWCAGQGERDIRAGQETVLAGAHVVHMRTDGEASAFRLQDGEALGWDSSVQEQPDEICAIGADHLGVQTRDRLWSTITLADGRVALHGEQRPASCLAVPVAAPPPSRVTSRTWVQLGDRRQLRDVFVRTAFRSSDGTRTFVIGLTRDQTRAPGMIGLQRGSSAVWRAVVPEDPLLAEASLPEAASITDESAFVLYQMTERGQHPRRIAAFSMVDGSRRWDVGLDGARGEDLPHVVAGEELVAMLISELMVVLDARTGELRFEIGVVN